MHKLVDSTSLTLTSCCGHSSTKSKQHQLNPKLQLQHHCQPLCLPSQLPMETCPFLTRFFTWRQYDLARIPHTASECKHVFCGSCLSLSISFLTDFPPPCLPGSFIWKLSLTSDLTLDVISAKKPFLPFLCQVAPLSFFHLLQPTVSFWEA